MKLVRYLSFLLIISPLYLFASVKVYVTNNNSQISVLNADNNTFVKNFTPSIGDTTASMLAGVAISPDQATAYVVDTENQGLWIINSANDSTRAFVAFDSASIPLLVAVTPDGSKVYIADRNASVVFVMLTSDNSVSTISGGAIKPSGLAFNPSGTKLYVTDAAFQADTIFVYDTSDDTLITTIDGVRANFIAINAQGIGYEPASDGTDGTDVVVFDTSTDTQTGIIETSGLGLDGVAFTTDGTTAYVASSEDATLQVIINGTLSTPIPLSAAPWQVAINPADQEQVYSTTTPSSTVMVVYDGTQISAPNFDANLTDANYFAYFTGTFLPSNLTGEVINNRFLLQTDIVHRLSWSASASLDVVSYAIFRNGVEIANVAALSYDDHNRSPNTIDFYEVKAVTADGTMSDPASIYIP